MAEQYYFSREDYDSTACNPRLFRNTYTVHVPFDLTDFPPGPSLDERINCECWHWFNPTPFFPHLLTELGKGCGWDGDAKLNPFNLFYLTLLFHDVTRTYILTLFS
jgi:hypothetical protein